MTIFCSHCRRPLQAEMSCLLRSGKQVPSTPRPFRSTKSASKARRDQINVELQALRSLLPISAREKERLSYLHTMALVCLQLRGAQLFPPGTHGTAVPHTSLALCGALLLPQNTTSHPAVPADLAPPAGLALGTELLSLLPGFLLVLSASGKLVYVSENVAQVLGLSVVRHALVSGLVPVLRAQHAAPADAGLWLQWALSSWCQRTAHWGWLSPPQQPSLNQVELLAQGDTVFDILDGQAHEDVRKQLLLAQEEPGREVTFVGEMHTSKAFRLQHGGNRAVAVHGRFAALGQPASSATTVFLALCTLVARLPTDGDAGSQDDLFQSTHILDMTFTDVTESVTYHLGYRREELIGQSWYSLLHPEDADLAAAQHRAVARGAGATAGTAVLRVLRRDHTWAWLRISARRDSGGHSITCTSHCLREEEAAYLRARQHRPTPRTAAAPPPAPAAVPPAGRELSLLAAQLRALADSLSPPATATWHSLWPEPEPFHPGAHETALGRLLGNALEVAGPPTAHAHCAPYARQ
ncbi:ribosomal RNA processing protein 36 homolog isoform X6 [Patagioenas fasciata]|uniref:ribosomal RNA processing protein 36 homolog isoform X6 n=1 Tax=Patagioenas fasciata TaxID=372321 RepID=UPI003A9973D1